MRFPPLWSVNAIAISTKVRFGSACSDLTGCGRWFSLMTSTVAGLWLRIAREREMRRRRAAWATIDDRTLRDLGVSRWELAHAEFRKRRATDTDVVQLCDPKMRRISAVRGRQLRAAFPECPVL
jgi:uncharacterized protein YjiS (DUF1127 family)